MASVPDEASDLPRRQRPRGCSGGEPPPCTSIGLLMGFTAGECSPSRPTSATSESFAPYRLPASPLLS